MSIYKPDYLVTDIDFENDDDDFQFDSHNSNPDEVLSQYSNSDMQEFNNLERDIYGSIDDVSSVDKMISQPLQEDNNNSTDDVSESLRLVLPNIQVRPFLGDPIQIYDKLRGQYPNDILPKIIADSPEPSDFSQVTPLDQRQSPINHRKNSRTSNGSAETVLSQNEEFEEPARLLAAPKSKTRKVPSSVSSNESTATKNSSHRSKNKATQKILLDQERDIRKDQDKYIGHLQHTINQLLTKHALAEETIDQLRLGVVLNAETKYNDQRQQRRTSTVVKKKTMPRRYSSIIDNANFKKYHDGPNSMSRAKSVDNGLFDDEVEPRNFSEKQHLINEFGGCMKQMTHSQSGETAIASDIRTIEDHFQSRIKILNEAANNLQYNSSGRASASSGSHNGDAMPIGGNKIVYDNQRHTPLAKRLKNLQMAYSDLQKDFNAFQQINKSNTPKNATRPKDSGLFNVDGDLFQLGMKIDDLERTIADGDVTLIDDNRVFENTNRDSELISRFTNVEEQYDNLMDRYNSLKGSRSPLHQRQLDDIVQQLQSLVRQNNGRYSTIPTPDKLETMIQIDKIKQHMTSDSPSYFLTEEDGLSSGHSSFGRGARRRHRAPRSDEDSDLRKLPVERLSPIKSRISTYVPEELADRRYSPKEMAKPNSLPVSVVSSSSMWLGATSGETLALDDQGILRESMSRKGNSSVGSEVFEFPTKSVDEIHYSRRQSKNNLYNEKPKSQISNSSFRPNNNSPLHDDIKRLDEQLEKVELEEKRQISAARDSDAAGSMHTRSLLGTTPSSSVMSKHSRQPSSVASSHRSQGTSSRGHGNYGRDDRPKVSRQKRRVKSRYNVPDSVSDSENDTPSDEYDVEDYVKAAGCGLGPRSRYIRNKNQNVQDRWSQTPPAFGRRPSDLRRPYCREYPTELDDPYIDDVAYWDGETFHPARESIPGKSILRQSSPHSKHRANSHRHGRPARYLSPDMDRFTRMPTSYYTEPNVSREYYKMDPYRYLVREYGHSRVPAFEQSIYEEESDLDLEEDDYRRPYDNYAEERRLRNYLDEAVKAAQSMKRYTKRISELCEQRKFEDNFAQLSAQRDYYRDFYT